MRWLPIVVGFLIITGGCLEGYPGLSEGTDWSLVTSGHTEENNEGVVFTGVVRLSGSTSAPTSIQGVRIQFIDREGATMKTISLGTLNASRWTANFSTPLDAAPERVLLLVKNVTDPDGRPPYTIVGLQRDDSGNYVPYHDYDPIQ